MSQVMRMIPGTIVVRASLSSASMAPDLLEVGLSSPVGSVFHHPQTGAVMFAIIGPLDVQSEDTDSAYWRACEALAVASGDAQAAETLASAFRRERL